MIVSPQTTAALGNASSGADTPRNLEGCVVSRPLVRRFSAAAAACLGLSVLAPASPALGAAKRSVSAAKASAVAADLGKRTLRRGLRGRDVRAMQRLLTARGVPVRADGVFGRGTERRVKRWETISGLPVDGRLSRADAALLLGRPAAATPRVTAVGAFPVAGPWQAGGEGAGFGERSGRHEGVDLMSPCGTPLVAPHAGTVVRVATHDRAGHYLVIRSSSTSEDHVLMHLREAPMVARGATVAAGQQVGHVGETGNARGCHLHFEIWTAPGWYEGGKPRDPQPDLDAWRG